MQRQIAYVDFNHQLPFPALQSGIASRFCSSMMIGWLSFGKSLRRDGSEVVSTLLAFN